MPRIRRRPMPLLQRPSVPPPPAKHKQPTNPPQTAAPKPTACNPSSPKPSASTVRLPLPLPITPLTTPPDFKDAYHARGQLAIQRGSLPRHAPKQPYSRRRSSSSKPTPSPDTASETITEDDNDDSNSDTSDSEHRKALPQPPAAPTLAPDPSVATTSNRKARRQQARFGPTPVVSHHPKDRDRDRDQWQQQQTRRPPGSGAGAADVTVGAAGSRRHQQAGTPEKEKRYWAEGGSVGSESEPVVAERGGPVGAGRGVVNGGGGSVGSGSSKAAAGGRRGGGGAGEGGGEGV